MRISCLQENLSKGLAVASRAVSSKSSLPILTHVLLDAREVAAGEGKMRLAATNLDVGISYWIAAIIEEPGAIAVPARVTADFVSALPTERIGMLLNDKTQTLGLKCGYQNANVKGIDAQEFPAMGGGKPMFKASLQAKGLRELLDRAAFAAATEDSRSILMGVLAEFNGKQVTLASADGFRLSLQKAVLTDAVEPFKAVIPAKALQEVSRVLGDQAEPVEISVNENRTRVSLTLTNIEVTAALIDGRFPDFERILPPEHSSRAVVTTGELMSAVKTISVFVDKNGTHNGIRLEADAKHGRVIVLGAHAERGDGVGEVDAAVEGESFHVSLQAPFLLQLLEHVSSPQLAIEFLKREPDPAPIVMRSVGEDEFLHVMMPLVETRAASKGKKEEAEKEPIQEAAK
ncbi:MAG: DNA polymerase III subunit beta [Chloroflexi bacterium]|nr:DNA polymerase III subunit beta [Chloroflexota bacterium]